MSLKQKTKRLKTYTLSLSKFELLHLRDLMSLNLPPNGERTVSQGLAELEDRTVVESFLWKKVCDLCNNANLPLGDEAPDYIVAPSGVPPMGIFMLASEPAQEESQPELGTENFLPTDGQRQK